jgi:cytochrome c553/cytochrome c5
MKRALFRWSLRMGVLLLVLGAAGLLVAASGVIPIKASSGHWAVTASFLQFAKRRSISTQTLGMKSPALEEPWLVLKGAGHYETGCRPCHGSPEFREPLIARALTPPPPYLGPRIAVWDTEELFYIVKHGIKLTGMPAWPAVNRDDEVRAVVAFLRELPKLNGDQYRRLVHGETGGHTLRAPLEDLTEPAPPAVGTTCARCHGARGQGRGNAAFPKLAGQKREYLLNALAAYARSRRHSGIMQPIAAPLAAGEMRELAAYYANLAGPAPEPAPAEATRLERGRDIANRGIPRQGVPSCMDCHGPGSHRRNEAYPLLAGQFADYLLLQLELFKSQQRGGSAYAHIMYNVASRLQPDQMRDVAAYYASLPAAPSL